MDTSGYVYVVEDCMLMIFMASMHTYQMYQGKNRLFGSFML